MRLVDWGKLLWISRHDDASLGGETGQNQGRGSSVHLGGLVDQDKVKPRLKWGATSILEEPVDLLRCSGDERHGGGCSEALYEALESCLYRAC